MESLSLFGFSWQMPGIVRTAIRTPAINQAKSLRLSDSLCCVYCTQFVAGTLYLCCILEQAIPGWHISQSHWCWLHALQLRPCDVACVNSDMPESNTADYFLIIMLAKLSSCHLVLPKKTLNLFVQTNCQTITCNYYSLMYWCLYGLHSCSNLLRPVIVDLDRSIEVKTWKLHPKETWKKATKQPWMVSRGVQFFLM